MSGLVSQMLVNLNSIRPLSGSETIVHDNLLCSDLHSEIRPPGRILNLDTDVPCIENRASRLRSKK